VARIRTIKPEFPQSETVGKLSRDARLLFIQIWTLADDSGRARAASRMLASLLYPYDDDAPKLINGWLFELEQNGCIRRYVVDGDTYLDIPNWLKHQKIDHPTKSRLPAFEESLANPREPSRALAPDLGPRTSTKDHGPIEGASPSAPHQPRGTRLALDALPEAWRAHCRADHPSADPDKTWVEFHDYWKARAGEKARKADWFATWRTWLRKSDDFKREAPNGKSSGSRGSDMAAAALEVGDRLQRDLAVRQRTGTDG
jgi:hypothetical protein